jgi:hypothetical protein
LSRKKKRKKKKLVSKKKKEEDEAWLIENMFTIALPPLPSLKRPLEQVKKDYKESYESLGQLCKVIRKHWIGFTLFI